ncbi:MAG TPA: DUF4439 domain-containing protein [Arthrobacter sp.]|nr:DUF4439 domain-containing protein [Arthrobacter sp.]
MKDDTTGISARRRYFRYAVFSLTALLVMSLGMALVPRQAPAPAETPFSERARTAALADTLALRTAAQSLAGVAAGEGTPPGAEVLDTVVTLLTIQARALVLPGGTAESPAATGPGQETTPRQSGDRSAPPAASASPGPSSAAELAAALSASGTRRLTDALEADGGMARLLAGAGAAQLLAARDVGAFAGVPPEELPGRREHPHVSEQPGTALAGCTSPEPSGEGGDIVDAAGAAVTAALESERETVYGYQAALTRLDPAAAAQASGLLAEHLDLAEEAEAYAALHCAPLPPAQPGYMLDTAFLDAPAAGLARLESGNLTALGDVVAFSIGPTRDWAVTALVAAAQRTAVWGRDPGAVPGLALDESRLPPLPGMPSKAATTASPAAG